MDLNAEKNNPVLTKNHVCLQLPASAVAGQAYDIFGAIATAYAAAVVLVPAMDPWVQVRSRLSGILISNASLNKCYVRGAGIGLGAGLTGQGPVIGTDCEKYFPIHCIPEEGLAYECASTIAVQLFFNE